MDNTLQDVIEREVVINAPKNRVFQAISEPSQIVNWFPNAVEGKLETGERAVLDFGKSGKAKIYIVAVTPDDYFAYRWIPGSNTHLEGIVGDILEQANTLVEFRLEEFDGKTKVVLKETGFASLPSETYERVFGENSQGWDFMLGRLEKLLN